MEEIVSFALVSNCRVDSSHSPTFILIYVGRREIGFCSRGTCEANRIIKLADARVS